MVGRLRRHQNLVVVCTVAAVVEALLVNAFAPTSSLGLATQITAPPPFGVFHDLRWIVVYHESWLGLAGELLAFLVFRSLLTAVCLRAAWPHDLALEPWAVTIRRSVVFTLIAGVLLAVGRADVRSQSCRCRGSSSSRSRSCSCSPSSCTAAR